MFNLLKGAYQYLSGNHRRLVPKGYRDQVEEASQNRTVERPLVAHLSSVLFSAQVAHKSLQEAGIANVWTQEWEEGVYRLEQVVNGLAVLSEKKHP
jgi:hypothetical protein